MIWTLLLASLAHAQGPTAPIRIPNAPNAPVIVITPQATSTKINIGLPSDPHRVTCTVTLRRPTATTPITSGIICTVDATGARAVSANGYLVDAAAHSTIDVMFGYSLVTVTLTSPAPTGPSTAATWCIQVRGRDHVTSGEYEVRTAGVF